MPVVTASIVVHGSAPSQLAKVLGCLEADGVSHVFVIDNSDDDRLRPVAQACGICTYRHVENRGFGAGHDEPFECSYLLGSFLFFRMSALTASGGFDERFFMYPEDIDITRRMTHLGKVLYWPRVSIIHEHAAASRHSARMLRIHITNMFRYFNKWGWLFDKERRIANRRMKSLPATANPEPGRG